MTAENTTTQIPDDIAALSYEDALAALRQVVSALEQGGATLEESLGLWERGEQLAAACLAKLQGAQERVDAARRANGDADGGSGPGSADGASE